MAVLEITKDNFEAEVGNSDKPVLIDFWAPWCGPCRSYGPIFAEASDEATGVKFCKVNVDDCGEIAGQFGVMSIPTTVFLRDGEVAGRFVGVKPKAAILAIIGETAPRE